MKFVKAKDPVVAELTGEKLEVEEKKNLVNQQMLKKMKAQQIFKKIITHSWRSRVSTQGLPRLL